MADPKTILIADDSDSIRTLLEMILTADAHQVTQVSDGREALNHLKDHTPDLIILDITMPFIDGLEVCSRIKRVSRLKATPVIILTAHTDPDTEKKAELVGADVLVHKPLSGKNFRTTILEMLEKREMLKAKQTQIGG
jgi:DNA-binding response OmpR family regulator